MEAYRFNNRGGPPDSHYPSSSGKPDTEDKVLQIAPQPRVKWAGEKELLFMRSVRERLGKDRNHRAASPSEEPEVVRQNTKEYFEGLWKLKAERLISHTVNGRWAKKLAREEKRMRDVFGFVGSEADERAQKWVWDAQTKKDSQDTSKQYKSWGEELIMYYNSSEQGKGPYNGRLWDPVLKDYGEKRVPTHIVPSKLDCAALAWVIGLRHHQPSSAALGRTKTSSARPDSIKSSHSSDSSKTFIRVRGNGLILHSAMKKGLDDGDFVLVPINPDEEPLRIKLVLLNEYKRNQSYAEGVNVTWGELDGRELSFKGDNRPSLRFLFMHFFLTFLRATRWTDPELVEKEMSQISCFKVQSTLALLAPDSDKRPLQEKPKKAAKEIPKKSAKEIRKAAEAELKEAQQVADAKQTARLQLFCGKKKPFFMDEKYNTPTLTSTFGPDPASSTAPVPQILPTIAPQGAPGGTSNAHTSRFACIYPGCTKTYTSATALAHHNRTHYFLCKHPGCTETYISATLLAQHKRTHNFVCTYPGCTMTYGSAKWFEKHKRTHNTAEDRKSTKGSSRPHVSSNHTVLGDSPSRNSLDAQWGTSKAHIGRFSCQYPGCTKIYSSPEWLENHKETHHKEGNHQSAEGSSRLHGSFNPRNTPPQVLRSSGQADLPPSHNQRSYFPDSHSSDVPRRLDPSILASSSDQLHSSSPAAFDGPPGDSTLSTPATTPGEDCPKDIQPQIPKRGWPLASKNRPRQNNTPVADHQAKQDEGKKKQKLSEIEPNWQSSPNITRLQHQVLRRSSLLYFGNIFGDTYDYGTGVREWRGLMGRLFGDFCFDDDDDGDDHLENDGEVHWERPIDLVLEILVRDVLCEEPADWEEDWAGDRSR